MNLVLGRVSLPSILGLRPRPDCGACKMVASDSDEDVQLDLENGDDVESTRASSVGGYESHGSHGGSSAVRAKAKGKGRGRGGRPSKTKNGKKWCRGCRKDHPLEVFPSGSADCPPNRRAIQNLRATAKKQKMEEWWADIEKHEEKLFTMIQQYHIRCPEREGLARGDFPMLVFQREEKQEEGILKDAVFEMMDLRTYQFWKAKPKNGALDFKRGGLVNQRGGLNGPRKRTGLRHVSGHARCKTK